MTSSNSSLFPKGLILALGLAAMPMSPLWAMPVVEGNTIHWTSDDWYQVQSAHDYQTLCEGREPCTVEPGSYNVINLTTGVRFNDIQVAGSGSEAFWVEGSVISWGGDDWYQVQRADDYSSVCEGGQFCEVPDGEYIVINHTSGKRYEQVFVPAGGGSVGSTESVTVTESTISWPDDGWYQVQNADTFETWCEGGRSCTVPDGSYHVVNHTTGERFEYLAVSTGEVLEPQKPGSAPGYLCSVKIQSESYYCYDQSEKQLSSHYSDGSTEWWSYVLPNATDSQAVWGIYLSEQGVDLLVHKGAAAGLFELARFTFAGDYLETVALFSELHETHSFYPSAWTTTARGKLNYQSNLVLAGESCQLNQAEETCVPYLAMVNGYSSSTVAYREFSRQDVNKSLSVTDWSVQLGGVEFGSVSLVDSREPYWATDYDFERGLDAGTVESTGYFLSTFVGADPVQHQLSLFLSIDGLLDIEGEAGLPDNFDAVLLNDGAELGVAVTKNLECSVGSGSAETTYYSNTSATTNFILSNCEYDGVLLDGELQRKADLGLGEGSDDSSISFTFSSPTLTIDSIHYGQVTVENVTITLSGIESGNDEVGSVESVVSNDIEYYEVAGAYNVQVSHTRSLVESLSEFNYREEDGGYYNESFDYNSRGGSVQVASIEDSSRILEFEITQPVSSTQYSLYSHDSEFDDTQSINTSSYTGEISIQDSNGNSLKVLSLASGNYLYEILDKGIKSYRIVPYTSFVTRL